MIDERSSSSISKKRFLIPREGSNLQPSDNEWDPLTIQLPRLTWQVKVQVRHMYDLSGRHDTSMFLNRYMLEILTADLTTPLRKTVYKGKSTGINFTRKGQGTCSFCLRTWHRAWYNEDRINYVIRYYPPEKKVVQNKYNHGIYNCCTCDSPFYLLL